MIGFYIGLAVVLVLLVRVSIRIVRQYQRIALFRLGRMVGTRGPGLVLVIPIVDRPGPGRPARAGSGNPTPERDHRGQRHQLDRLHLLHESH
jgi:hypothetical protein